MKPAQLTVAILAFVLAIAPAIAVVFDACTPTVPAAHEPAPTPACSVPTSLAQDVDAAIARGSSSFADAENAIEVLIGHYGELAVRCAVVAKIPAHEPAQPLTAPPGSDPAVRYQIAIVHGWDQ